MSFRVIDNHVFAPGDVVEFDWPNRGRYRGTITGAAAPLSLEPGHRCWSVSTCRSVGDQEPVVVDVDEAWSNMTHSKYG